MEDWVEDSLEELSLGEVFEYQRIDNSDDTSEVIAASDEYFSIPQEGC